MGEEPQRPSRKAERTTREKARKTKHGPKVRSQRAMSISNCLFVYQLGLAQAATRPNRRVWNILEHVHLFTHSCIWNVPCPLPFRGASRTHTRTHVSRLYKKYDHSSQEKDETITCSWTLTSAVCRRKSAWKEIWRTCHRRRDEDSGEIGE